MKTKPILLPVVVWLVAAVHGAMAQLPVVRVDGVVVTGTIVRGGAATVALESGFVGGTAFYTLDGTEPNFSSSIYGGPFAITNNATVRVLGVSADLTQTGRAPGVVVLMVKTAVTGSGSVGIATQPGSATVTLTATADANWSFHHWEDDAAGLPNPTVLNVSVSRVVRAVFVQTAFPLTASTPGGGNVALNPAQAFYPSNTVVTLTATSSNGWSFMRWEGDIASTLNPVAVAMNAAKNIRAVFGTMVISNVLGSGDIHLGATNPVPFGTVVRVTAVPATGNYFRQWGGVLTGGDSPANFTVTNPTPTVAGLFAALPPGSVTLTMLVDGPGRVRRSPDKSFYDLGERVVVTAEPDAPGWFRGWSEGGSGLTNSMTSILSRSVSIEARFGRPSGTVVAWGTNDYGQTDVPIGLSGVVAIAAGGHHILALRNDGSLVAWGAGGTGGPYSWGQTIPPGNLGQVTAIAAGGFHSMALKDDGTVATWGHSPGGRIAVPEGLNSVVAIAAGWVHSAALRRDGRVVVWGELGANREIEVPVGVSNIIAIAGGFQHMVALREDHTVIAWGMNGLGQTNVPSGLNSVVGIAAGRYHSLAIKDTGEVVAWGEVGELVTIPGSLLPGAAVAGGWAHTMVLERDGTVKAWGFNTSGQIDVPAGLRDVTAIGAGHYFSVAIVGDAPPRIGAMRNGGQWILRWQDTLMGHRMESAPRLSTAPVWSPVDRTLAATNNGVISISLSANEPERFFRLVKP